MIFWIPFSYILNKSYNAHCIHRNDLSSFQVLSLHECQPGDCRKTRKEGIKSRLHIRQEEVRRWSSVHCAVHRPRPHNHAHSRYCFVLNFQISIIDSKIIVATTTTTTTASTTTGDLTCDSSVSRTLPIISDNASKSPWIDLCTHNHNKSQIHPR